MSQEPTSNNPNVSTPNAQLTDNPESFVTLDDFLKTGTAYNLLDYSSLPPVKQNYIKQQIINFLYVASQQLNSVSGGRIAPVWAYLKTLPETSLTPLQKADKNYITNAIIKWVDYLIYTQGVFADVNIDAPANLPFSLTGKSSNADVENVRRDVIQMLNNTSFYNTLTTYEDRYSNLFTKGCIESIKYISDEALKVIQDWCNTQFYPAVPFRKDVDLLNNYDLLNPRNIFSSTATDKQNVPNVSKISGFDINVTSNSINFIDDNAVVPNQTWSSQKINTFLGHTTDFATQNWVNEQLTPIKENIDGFANQLPDYQKKLVAGQNIVLDPITNIISASVQGQDDLASKVWVNEQLEPLNTNIATNKADISTNKAYISANTTKIAENTTKIVQNTTDITNLKSEQLTLSDKVNSNTTDIETINTATLPTYQKKLIAGNNITIDETTNTISSSGGGSGSDLLNSNNLWNGTNGWTNDAAFLGKTFAVVTGGVLNGGIALNVAPVTQTKPTFSITPIQGGDPTMGLANASIEIYGSNLKINNNELLLTLEQASGTGMLFAPNILVGSTFTSRLGSGQYNPSTQTFSSNMVITTDQSNSANPTTLTFENMKVDVPSPTTDANPTTKAYVDNAITTAKGNGLPNSNYYAKFVTTTNLVVTSPQVIHFPQANIQVEPSGFINVVESGGTSFSFTENGIYGIYVNFWTNGSNTLLAQLTCLSSSGANVTFEINAGKQWGNAFIPPPDSDIFAYWEVRVINATAQTPQGIALRLNSNKCTIGGLKIRKLENL